VKKIQENLLKWYEQQSSLKLNLPAFAPIFNGSDKSQMNHLHHFLKVIPNFENREQAKNDFVTLSRRIYSDEKNEKKIADFEKTYNQYNKEAVLRWYTQQSFLYKVTNNCLRIATSDSIQYSRLLLKDLERAIKEQYWTESRKFCGLLYRGSYLSQEEWVSLQDNVGQEVEMLGFLSTSKEKRVALNFMGVNPAEKVLITIIVPKGPNEEKQGFAEIEEFSEFKNEKEILFNVRSRFTVLETEVVVSEQKLSYRHLVLLYGAQGFRKTLAEKNFSQEVSISNVEKMACSRCKLAAQEILFRALHKEIFLCYVCMINSDISAPLLCVPISSNNQYKMKIKGCALATNLTKRNLPMYGYSCGKCRARKQRIYYVCTNCSKKEKIWCETCFKNDESCFKVGHAVILETTPFSFWCEKMSEKELNHLKFQDTLINSKKNGFQQGEMYLQAHNFEKAKEYYTTHLQKNKTNIYCSHKLGQIYEMQGDNNKALDSISKISDTADYYRQRGKIHGKRREYKEALKCHLQSLEMKKSLSKKENLDIALSYNDVGHMYDRQNQFKQALEYYLKALKIRRDILGDRHPTVAHSIFHLGLLSNRRGEYEEAKKYFSKALKIREMAYGTNHHQVASCLYQMGIVSYNQQEYKKALEFQFEALEIRKFVFQENHPDIASCYFEIAKVFLAMEEYENALEYNSKALKIRKSLQSENPSDFTISQNLAEKIHQEIERKKRR